MSKLPYIRHYPADYLVKTIHLTVAQDGLYRRLLDQMWIHGGTLPNDHDHLTAICRVSSEEWCSLWPEVSVYFPVMGDEITNKRLNEERKRASNISETAKANGKRAHSGRSAGAKRALTTRTHIQSQSQSQSQSQKKKDTLRASTSSGFDAFWSEYPRKVGKIDARKAWASTKTKRPPLAQLLAKVTALAGSHDWLKESSRYVPNPATWLRRGGWDDEVRIRKVDTGDDFGDGSGSAVQVYCEECAWSGADLGEYAKHVRADHPPKLASVPA